MDDLLSEKEQIEAIRSWWQVNGRYVISGIVLGVAILVGWNQWQAHQRTTRLQASALYETLAREVDDGDLEASEAAAVDLYDNYASTTYAALASLAMAKLYMEKGRDQDAADTLNALLTVRGHSRLPIVGWLQALVGVADFSELQMVGRLRLAKVYLYQNKNQEVIELLSGFEDTSFSARYDELLGDAYVALGQIAEATAAYERSMMDDVSAPTVNRALVQMKLVDLPDDAPVDEPEMDEGTAVDPVEPASDPVDER